jgi:hypothetical protein
MEILEFSCPCDHVSSGKEALKKTYEQKQSKHAELGMELQRMKEEDGRGTVIIVRLTGAVYEKSLKGLQKVVGYNDRAARKRSKKKAETVPIGPLEI